LIAEQYRDDKAYVRTNKKGKKEIVDPATTSARIYLYFYLLINIGSLTGSIAMVYAEHFVGFYLSFLLPTIVFAISPLVLFVFKKHYHLSPPTGSVMGKAAKLIKYAFKKRESKNPLKDVNFWERVKPSNIAVADRPAWMTFDDAWVDEVRRGLLACKVFLWYPLYCKSLSDDYITSNANNIRAGLQPNDQQLDLASQHYAPRWRSQRHFEQP
jgi:POT family proton-dependent oligopeptide transporter